MPSANRRRFVPSKAWKKGQSGNPKGRPAEGESWAAIIKEISAMTAGDIIKLVGRNNDLGKQLAALPKNVMLKRLVVARVLAALMFEPSPGLWSALMDRAEGKVKDELEMSGSVEIEGLDRMLSKVYGMSGKSGDEGNGDDRA